jgi:hypothetical protein
MIVNNFKLFLLIMNYVNNEIDRLRESNRMKMKSEGSIFGYVNG